MSEIKVVIPWRHEPSRVSGPHWVCEYYRHRLGESCIHIEADYSVRPFNKSKCINRGVEKFPNATVVIGDTDCVITDQALRRSIAEAGDKMTLPHNCFCRTNRPQAVHLLSLDPKQRVSGKMFRHRRGRAATGGLWVVRAELFLQYRMDERFEGLGTEDTEFLRRIPHERLPGPLFHIWHRRPSAAHWARNRRLARRIRNERNDK